jgi:glycosyltransferase involved in cell wall biosynthesis
VEEVVKHGVNGIVAPAEDVGAAATAVADLLENEPYRDRLAGGARLTDLSSWGLDAMCESVEEVYRSVLEQAPIAARPNDTRIRDSLAKQPLGLHGF